MQAKPHVHLCYYAHGVVVMFKTWKLRGQITSWNSASASSLVSSNASPDPVPSSSLAFNETTPTKR